MLRRLSTIAALAVAPFVLAPFIGGCHTTSGPRPTLNVAIGLVPPPVTTTSVENGVTKINCDARLQATATGEGEATWEGGTVFFFRGNDESKVFDSANVTQAQLISTWGSPSIVGGETRTTVYRLTGTEPFGGVVEFRYRQSGGRDARVTRVPVHCSAG